MTRIELVSSGVVDLYDDIPINQTFSIYDIEDPSSRSGSWSKTITLPGTSNNNDIFKHIYEVDSYCNFDPLVKAKVVVYSDDVLFMQGYMLLSNVIKKESLIEYEVNIFTDNSNLFFDIGEGLMQDLDISQYNQEYSGANIEASWTGTLGEGIVYPMIDYGYNLGQSKWTYSLLRPAVYVKTYIDAIFSKYGYTYTSPFFESEEFRRLIIPWAGGEFKLEQYTIYDEIVRSYVNSSQAFTTKTPAQYSSNPFTNVIQFQNEVLDGQAQFNPSTGIFTATKDRTLIITVDNMAWTKTGGFGGITEIQICIKTVYGGFGVLKSIPISGFSSNTGTQQTSQYNVKTGDQIFVRVYKPIGTGTFTVTTGTFATDFADPNIALGDTVEVNKFIPKKIKQKDFFMSIIKMFNLFIDINKNNPTNLIIEPRNDFYSSGVVNDWSSKVDYSKPITISPILQKLKGKYNYSYKSDKDYLNAFYQDKYEEVYGSKTWDLDNSLTKGEDKLEITFSPTQMLNNNGIIFSKIANSNGTSQSEFNIRILYYGGLKVAPLGWVIQNQLKLTYPYCGHLDDPTLPTKDLCFGVPKEVYHQPVNYTNGNLFNRFHKQNIIDISNKDSRIIEAYLILNPIDIAQLDFRNIFYVDGHYVRLLEISDYNPNSTEPTKCTFMKIITKDIAHSDSYTYSSTVIYGGSLQQFD